jgi:hypothetical protein
VTGAEAQAHDGGEGGGGIEILKSTPSVLVLGVAGTRLTLSGELVVTDTGLDRVLYPLPGRLDDGTPINQPLRERLLAFLAANQCAID